MRKAIMIITLLSLLMLSGCGKQNMEQMLSERGVPFTSVTEEGTSVTVYYEASEADEYDSQIVADWGIIMGTAASQGFESIKIVNTISSIPFTVVETTSENIDGFTSGAKNESEFWMDVEIKAIK